MADIFALLHPQSRDAEEAASAHSQPAVPGEADEPMAAPSSVDVFLGRDKMGQTFNAERKSIVGESLVEKRRTRRSFSEQRGEERLRLEKGDPRAFQRWGIKPTDRPIKPGLNEYEKKRYLERSLHKMEEKLMRKQRKAIDAIDRQTTLRIREVRDSLHERVYRRAA